MFFIILLTLSSVIHLLFFFISSKSSFEGEPFSTDAGKQIQAINNFSKWKYISDLHKFSNGKSRMKDIGVIFILLIHKIFPKFYSFTKVTTAILLANFLSTIIFFFLIAKIFNQQTALFCSIIYLFSFWPYMIILHGGFHIVSQLFSLLTILILFDANSLFSFFLAGLFMCCTMFSSASSRKFYLLIYSCLFFKFIDPLKLESFHNYKSILILFLLTILLWKSKFYFPILHNLLIKIFNKTISFNYFSKIFSQFLKTIILIFFPLIVIFILTNDSSSFFYIMAFFLLGSFVAFLIINYPVSLENIIGYLRYTDMSDVAHFNKIKNYFDKINEKIINGMRAEKSGILWIVKYLFLIIRYEIFLLLLLSFFYFYLNGSLINYILVLVISLTPIIIGEISKGPQIGRSYYPFFIGFVFFIGFIYFNISSSTYLYMIVFLGSVYNFYLLFTFIIPERTAVYKLMKYLKKEKIREIYIYNSKFYDWVIPPLKDMLPSLKVRYINTHDECLNKHLLIPGQSHKVVNNFGISEDDFDLDKVFINDVNSGTYDKNILLKLKNMGTSKFWMHEDEVSSYRYLLLKDISQNDIDKSFLKLIYINKT